MVLVWLVLVAAVSAQMGTAGVSDKRMEMFGNDCLGFEWREMPQLTESLIGCCSNSMFSARTEVDKDL